MRNITTIICALLFAGCLFAQPPQPKPVTDSIQKVQADSINNLLRTKMSINAEGITAALDLYKSRISAKEYEQHGKAIDDFIQTLLLTWLEINKREQSLLKNEKKKPIK